MADYRVYSGCNGSGKTARVVKHLLRHYYFKRDDLWIPVRHIRLVSNIDGLKLPHVSLDEDIADAGGKSKYFSKDYQIELSKLYGEIVYIIDEAQFYFPSNLKDEGIQNWMQWYRHIGQTIIMLTQHKNLLPKDFMYYCDHVVDADRISAKALKNVFTYRFLHPISKEILGTERVVIGPEVFAVYKSQELDAGEKPKRLLLKKALIPLISGFVVLVLSGWFFLHRFLPDGFFDDQTEKGDSVKSSPKVISSSKKTLGGISNHSIPSNSSSSVNHYSDFQLDPQLESQLTRIKISYFINYIGKNQTPYLRLMYHGVYSAEQFPYKYEFVGKDCYAYIPSSPPSPSPEPGFFPSSSPVANAQAIFSQSVPQQPAASRAASYDSKSVGPLLVTVGG